MSVVRPGDILFNSKMPFDGKCVVAAYPDMIKFEDGSEMWVDPGKEIRGWCHSSGRGCSAPVPGGTPARGVEAKQILLHKTEPGLNWSTGPDCLLPEKLADYMHEDGTPVRVEVESKFPGTAGNLVDIGTEIRKTLACPNPIFSTNNHINALRFFAGLIGPRPEATFSFKQSELARKLFENDERTKLAMSKLEVPMVDKAYARGIFGYEPECQWATSAWELADALTR